MAKRRRRNRNFQAWPVDQSITLGALANNTVLKSTLINLTQEAYMISADLTWAVHDGTSGEGPIDVGVADNALSVTEINEKLSAAPVSQSDRISLERATRPVRVAGVVPDLGTLPTLNDGKKIRTSMKWMQAAAVDPCMWARNKSGATLTTGTIVHATGVIYGVWR